MQQRHAEYFLKKRHPWWDSWIAFENLRRSGKALHSNLSPAMILLGRDAHFIYHLQATMPDPVKRKYQSALLDDDRAKDYLLELHIAWSFYAKGHQLKWFEDEQATGHEFTVVTPAGAFNVECKAISADISRKIKRENFYRLFDRFVTAMYERELSGYVRVVLDSALPTSEVELSAILCEILASVETGAGRARWRTSGSLEWMLTSCGAQQEQRAIVDAFGGVLTPDSETALITKGDRKTDPLALSMTCRKRSSVVRAIMKRLGDAGKRRQLPVDEPGLLVCYVPEVPEYKGLGSESSLADMMNLLLNRDYMKDVAAVHFISDPKTTRTETGSVIGGDVLTFENASSKHIAFVPLMKL